MLKKVNADFKINVTTYVDMDDVDVFSTETLDEAITREAVSQILCGNYDPGDPVDTPEVNWIEDEDD